MKKAVSRFIVIQPFLLSIFGAFRDGFGYLLAYNASFGSAFGPESSSLHERHPPNGRYILSIMKEYPTFVASLLSCNCCSKKKKKKKKSSKQVSKDELP